MQLTSLAPSGCSLFGFSAKYPVQCEPWPHHAVYFTCEPLRPRRSRRARVSVMSLRREVSATNQEIGAGHYSLAGRWRRLSRRAHWRRPSLEDQPDLPTNDLGFRSTPREDSSGSTRTATGIRYFAPKPQHAGHRNRRVASGRGEAPGGPSAPSLPGSPRRPLGPGNPSGPGGPIGPARGTTSKAARGSCAALSVPLRRATRRGMSAEQAYSIFRSPWNRVLQPKINQCDGKQRSIDKRCSRSAPAVTAGFRAGIACYFSLLCTWLSRQPFAGLPGRPCGDTLQRHAASKTHAAASITIPGGPGGPAGPGLPLTPRASVSSLNCRLSMSPWMLLSSVTRGDGNGGGTAAGRG